MLDKELYKRMYAAYRQWNKAELAEQVRNAGQLAPAQAWRRYVELVELCWKLSPPQSEAQQKQKTAELARYYERVQKLEAWRREHGKTA
ncbi:MAG: hypothetical protein JW850_19265 [Thermoflexales bacterium]|nr:hypothetical protein [Thermoflexales bacterium]